MSAIKYVGFFSEINLDPILKESIILNIYYLLYQMSNIKNRIIAEQLNFIKNMEL